MTPGKIKKRRNASKITKTLTPQKIRSFGLALRGSGDLKDVHGDQAQHEHGTELHRLRCKTFGKENSTDKLGDKEQCLEGASNSMHRLDFTFETNGHAQQVKRKPLDEKARGRPRIGCRAPDQSPAMPGLVGGGQTPDQARGGGGGYPGVGLEWRDAIGSRCDAPPLPSQARLREGGGILQHRLGVGDGAGQP